MRSERELRGVDTGRTPCTLQPTPYTLHPTRNTLHPTRNTLHPTPYTLHPTPYTLHPTPYTLHLRLFRVTPPRMPPEVSLGAPCSHGRCLRRSAAGSTSPGVGFIVIFDRLWFTVYGVWFVVYLLLGR